MIYKDINPKLVPIYNRRGRKFTRVQRGKTNL